ncbi:hypothetical protein SHIRM173S_09525 [Streptomyces hirsutus]
MAGPAARRFFAAFTSRSWVVPHVQVQVRTCSGIFFAAAGAARLPQGGGTRRGVSLRKEP